MLFRIAATLGKTVAELEETLSAEEFMEWCELFQDTPWGPEADFYRTGVIAATMLNIHRDPKRKREPWQPSDFMPKRKKAEKEGVSGQELKAKFLSAFAGRVKHGRQGDISDQGRGRDGPLSGRIRPQGRAKSRNKGPTPRR